MHIKRNGKCVEDYPDLKVKIVDILMQMERRRKS